jgi:phosphoribosylamine--glycine ligase
LEWKSGASACLVLASGGYPGKFESGKVIHGLAEAEQVPDVKVLHAGTKRSEGNIITNGGRVLGVTAVGASLQAALKLAYEAAGKIHFDEMHYRRDIGRHREQGKAVGDVSHG